MKRLFKKQRYPRTRPQIIGTLSKGYKQRVGLAAALLHDPKYLILDEPTTGLDPNQVIEIRKLIQSLGKKKLVFLSHILQEVGAMCDRVIILNKGIVVLNKSLNSIKNHYQQVIISVSLNYQVENIALQKIPNLKTVVNTFDFEYELTAKTNEDMDKQF